MAKYLTLDGLGTFWAGVKTKLAGKVDVVEGKGLSTNDLTDELKAVYDAHETNVIVGVSVNGSGLTADGERIVDITVPTATSALTNDSDFATNTGVAGTYYNKTEMDGKVETINQAITDASTAANAAVEATNTNLSTNYYDKTAIDEAVDRLEQAIGAGSTDVADNYYDKNAIDGKVSAIEEAIAAAAAGKVTISVVDAIPAIESAQANVIYFVPRENDETNNIYDQYMLIDGVIEAVGSTEVNLAEYVKSADLNAISDDEIDGVLAS